MIDSKGKKIGSWKAENEDILGLDWLKMLALFY